MASLDLGNLQLSRCRCDTFAPHRSHADESFERHGQSVLSSGCMHSDSDIRLLES